MLDDWLIITSGRGYLHSEPLWRLEVNVRTYFPATQRQTLKLLKIMDGAWCSKDEKVDIFRSLYKKLLEMQLDMEMATATPERERLQLARNLLLVEKKMKEVVEWNS